MWLRMIKDDPDCLNKLYNATYEAMQIFWAEGNQHKLDVKS
jgi:hypothetical protein